jgi:hypothetical protein
VRDHFAWFTTAPLAEQWGDDWDDAPYQDNGGDPYEWDAASGRAQWELTKVAYDSGLVTPCESTQFGRAALSVKDMNTGIVPWLMTDRIDSGPQVAIHAGTTLARFVETIEADGGTVYLPRTKEAPTVFCVGDAMERLRQLGDMQVHTEVMLAAMTVERDRLQRALDDAHEAAAPSIALGALAWRFLRPCGQAYATAIERRLRANDDKPGWQCTTPEWLLAQACGQVIKVGAAISHEHIALRDVLRHAANAGAYMMMVADNLDCLMDQG